MNGFSVVSQQVNVFPRLSPLDDANRTAKKLLELPIFNGPPTVLPLGGPEAPSGVVVVTVRSNDGLNVCEVSKEKIAITWLNAVDIEPKTATSIVETTQKVLSAIYGREQHYRRIGFVTTVGKKITSATEGVELLTKEDCRLQMPEQDSMLRFFATITYDLQLTTHEKSLRVMTAGPANRSIPPNEEIFAIQQDLSTQPDEGLDFGLEFIKDFTNETHKLSSINKIVQWLWQ